MNPKVSIIITCYNYGKYLEEVLDNVFNSYYDNFEVILVDDGSNDKYTLDILEKIKNKNIKDLNIIRQENTGVSGARNTGLSVASGEYVMFIDTDDKIDKEYILKCVDILERQSEYSFVYTNSIFFNDKRRVKIFNLRYNFYSLLFRNYIPITSLIRKAAIIEVGGYKKCSYEDWELYINLGEHNFFGYYLKEYLFFYRVHNDSKQKKDDLKREENIREIKNIHRNLYSKENILKLKKIWYKGFIGFIFSEIFRIIRAGIIRIKLL